MNWSYWNEVVAFDFSRWLFRGRLSSAHRSSRRKDISMAQQPLKPEALFSKLDELVKDSEYESAVEVANKSTNCN